MVGNKTPYVSSEVIEDNYSEYDGNRIHFATYLHSLYSDRTIKAWEMAIIRWERAKATADPNFGTYTYDTEADEYTTYLVSGPLTMPGETVRSIRRDYTANMKLADVSAKYDIPQNTLREFKRIHKIMHTSSSLTDEELLDDDWGETVAAIVDERRHDATKVMHEAEMKALRKDAASWRRFEETVLNVLKESIEKPADAVPRLALPQSKNQYALVVCPTDFHWGKHGWKDEVGETYNFDEARARLFDKTQALIDRLSTAPERIYVGAGSDWFHVDNDAGTTTRGTPQDMCASPAEILISGCRLAREHIDLLRQVAPVEIVMMPGNHDRHSSYALMMYLSAAYEDCPDVNIETTALNRRYLQYGNTLLGFTHGDSLSRSTNLPALMANEARQLWGQVKHGVWFHGHLHHQQLTERDGCLIVQMPSLAGHDRYHYRAGYTTSTAGLAAYLIDVEDGYLGSFFAPVSHEG
jgi:predicted phosphodiesterase